MTICRATVRNGKSNIKRPAYDIIGGSFYIGRYVGIKSNGYMRSPCDGATQG